MASKYPKQIYYNSNSNISDEDIYNRYSPNNYKGKKVIGTVIPNRIFVGGIPPKVTDQELRQLFCQYGIIKTIKIVMDKFGVSRGYAFITYETEESVKRLQNNANNLILKDRRLNIAPAVQKIPQYSDGSDTSSSYTPNYYMSNGIPYTFHNGMAFFSTSQQYTPAPITVISPQPTAEAAQYYPFVYQQTAATPAGYVGSSYSPSTALVYPLSNALPIYVGNQQCSFQSIATVPNQGSEYIYNSGISVIPPPTVTSAQKVSPPSVDNHASLLDASMNHYSGSEVSLSSQSSHSIEGQQILQAVPTGLYYNMMPDVYPVMAVNSPDSTLQYCKIPTNVGRTANGDTVEAASYNANHPQERPNSESEPNQDQQIQQQQQHQVQRAQSGSYRNEASVAPEGSSLSYSDTHLALTNPSMQMLPPPPYAEQQAIGEPLLSLTHHVPEYSSSVLQHSTSVIYPGNDNSQNFFINKLYLGTPVAPLQYQYPKHGMIPYANDRPPKNDGRYKKRYSQTEEPPNIPKFPFYLDRHQSPVDTANSYSSQQGAYNNSRYNGNYRRNQGYHNNYSSNSSGNSNNSGSSNHSFNYHQYSVNSNSTNGSSGTSNNSFDENMGPRPSAVENDKSDNSTMEPKVTNSEENRGDTDGDFSNQQGYSRGRIFRNQNQFDVGQHSYNNRPRFSNRNNYVSAPPHRFLQNVPFNHPSPSNVSSPPRHAANSYNNSYNFAPQQYVYPVRNQIRRSGAQNQNSKPRARQGSGSSNNIPLTVSMEAPKQIITRPTPSGAPSSPVQSIPPPLLLPPPPPSTSQQVHHPQEICNQLQSLSMQ